MRRGTVGPFGGIGGGPAMLVPELNTGIKITLLALHLAMSPAHNAVFCTAYPVAVSVTRRPTLQGCSAVIRISIAWNSGVPFSRQTGSTPATNAAWYFPGACRKSIMGFM